MKAKAPHPPFRLAKIFFLYASLLLLGTGGANASDSTTSLVLDNQTGQPVTVGVILAALGGACPSSHPPVTAQQLKDAGFCDDVVNSPNAPYAGKCSLTLQAHSKKTFPSISGTCISGNVTFGGYASCPSANFPTGTTTAEFTLNPDSGLEAVDISLVNGYSDEVEISMQGGGSWSDGKMTVTKVVNSPLGKNVGNPGVYPKNCTDCTQLVGAPVCPGFSPSPVCQKAGICNIQRGTYGGTVTVSLLPKCRDVEAGPIWDNADAQKKCPATCNSVGSWNGQWKTTQPGTMSVCGCCS